MILQYGMLISGSVALFSTDDIVYPYVLALYIITNSRPLTSNFFSWEFLLLIFLVVRCCNCFNFLLWLILILFIFNEIFLYVHFSLLDMCICQCVRFFLLKKTPLNKTYPPMNVLINPSIVLAQTRDGEGVVLVVDLSDFLYQKR